MKLNKSVLAALILGGLSLSSCRDEFATLNQDKSAVVTPNISYLFAEAVNKFEPQGYLEYFYNAPMMYSWSGMGISSGGASESILTLTATGDKGSQYLKTLRVVREMEDIMNKPSYKAEDKAINMPYVAATKILTIYLGLFDSDLYGDIPYLEACKKKFGGEVTAPYDPLEQLYDLWITDLNEAITVFTTANARMISSQDVVYGGKVDKWAKFANSLKLRIAVRLLNQNATKAKAIASDVENATCGYLNSIEDDVLFNKMLTTTNDGRNDYIYHWSNGFSGCAGSQTVVDLMIKNLDPRVRFFYKKNNWNSKVIQGFYDAGKSIPDFIEKNVVYTVGTDGKKHFEKWGGFGEPWVRYYGMTEDWMASNDATGKHKWYFPSSYPNAASELTLYDKDGKNPKQYTVFSTLNQMMLIGRTYTAAAQVESSTLPGDAYTFKTNDRPWYGMYLSSAEVNLYLAEFAMLSGRETDASNFYKKALRLSVQEYDKLAKLNQVAYYSNVAGCFGYDSNEGAIDLKDGEIDAMLNGAEYDFTGTASQKLEKIYLQQMLHFTLYPNEQYVTARRSGYPSFNSTILPRKQYVEVPATKIPRRFPTGTVIDTDKMGPFKIEAFKRQGLTPTADGLYNQVLHDERLWTDKNAPEWGAGK